jgi:hypothetical protein
MKDPKAFIHILETKYKLKSKGSGHIRFHVGIFVALSDFRLRFSNTVKRIGRRNVSELRRNNLLLRCSYENRSTNCFERCLKSVMIEDESSNLWSEVRTYMYENAINDKNKVNTQ